MVKKRIQTYGRTAFASLKIRNYRLYFIGQGISLVGTWTQIVGLSWLVLAQTGSPAQLGIIVSLQFLPLLTLGWWGGIVADRMDKRVLQYYTQTAFAILAGALSYLVYTHSVTLPLIYLIAAASGVVRIFDDPVKNSFVTEIVGADNVRNAVSLNAMENNLGRILGPSFAGLLIAGVGVAACFLVNALSFLAVILMLAFMKRDRFDRPSPDERPEGLLDGFRYVKQIPLMRNTLIVATIFGAFVYQFQTNLPIFAEKAFNADPLHYAAFFSSFGLGAVIGGLVSAGKKQSSQKELVILSALFGASILITAAAPTVTLATILVALCGFFAINVSSVMNALIQRECEDRMRGRVMALWSMAMGGATPLGSPFLGLAAEYYGGRASFVLTGIMASVAAVCAYIFMRTSSRVVEVPATQATMRG